MDGDTALRCLYLLAVLVIVVGLPLMRYRRDARLNAVIDQERDPLPFDDDPDDGYKPLHPDEDVWRMRGHL